MSEGQSGPHKTELAHLAAMEVRNSFLFLVKCSTLFVTQRQSCSGIWAQGQNSKGREAVVPCTRSFLAKMGGKVETASLPMMGQHEVSLDIK